jgi:hypothetical protein
MRLLEVPKAGRWKSLPVTAVGPMALISDALLRMELFEPGWIPYLGAAKELWIVADCAGSRAEPFEVLSFLITAEDLLGPWLVARNIVRKQYLGDGRRISYKKLGSDKIKRRALGPFLDASALIPGVLITIAIDTKLPSMFGVGKTGVSKAAHEHGVKPEVFERLMRTLHFLSLLVGGFSYPGQDVLWLNDEDAILANDEIGERVALLWNDVLRMYLSHSLRQPRFGTTAADPGDRHIEDLAALPDIAAGAVLEVVRSHPMGSTIRLSAGTRANSAMTWLGQREKPLAKRFLKLTVSDDLTRGPMRFDWMKFDTRPEPSPSGR